MPAPNKDPVGKIMASISVTAGGCWIWGGKKNMHGYGVISVYGKKLATHRVIYAGKVGPIPDGMVIDHLCRNRACVNPAHLEVVTGRENTPAPMPNRPERDLPRIYTPDTTTDRLALTALMLGILAVFIMIGGMG